MIILGKNDYLVSAAAPEYVTDSSIYLLRIFMIVFLGISPKNDSQGVLQDIHWSGIEFGGFPCYTIGNVVDGILWHAAKKDGEIDLTKAITRGQIMKIRGWLGEKIHRFGATYAHWIYYESSFARATTIPIA